MFDQQGRDKNRCVQCAMKRKRDDQIKRVCGFDRQGRQKKKCKLEGSQGRKKDD
jgi:hypothetical protein